MHVAFAIVGGLGRERCGRQAADEVGGHLDRVDHRVLREARMRVEAVEADEHRVARERLHLDLAQCGAVHRVCELRAEARHVEMRRVPADFLVRREAETDRTVRNLRVRDQVLGRRHDLGDARLVVGAEQRLA
jgi:hypothetical protein